jgi:hypothetical protein
MSSREIKEVGGHSQDDITGLGGGKRQWSRDRQKLAVGIERQRQDRETVENQVDPREMSL